MTLETWYKCFDVAEKNISLQNKIFKGTSSLIS